MKNRRNDQRSTNLLATASAVGCAALIATITPARADVISTFETGLDNYTVSFGTPFTATLSNQYVTDGAQSLKLDHVGGSFQVGGQIYLDTAAGAAATAKFNDFTTSTKVMLDMTFLPGTAGWVQFQAGLKSSAAGGPFIRSGANPPPTPGIPYVLATSPVYMTDPVTMTYVYDFGAVGFDFAGVANWMQLWLIGNSGLNPDPYIHGTDPKYTLYLDNIRVLKQLATDPVWNVSGSGDWTNPGNWANGVPNAIDARATLGTITTGTTVALNSNVTLGQLVMDSANTAQLQNTTAPPYTVNGNGTLTFDVSTGRAKLYAINQWGSSIAVVNPTYAINVPVVANDDLLVDVSTGATMSFGGTLTLGAGKTLSKSSAGTTNLNGDVVGAGSVQLRGGVTNVNANMDVSNLTVMASAKAIVSDLPAGTRIVRTGGLTVDGSLDLVDNTMIVNTTSRSQVEAYVIAGRNGGAWNGATGITSSAARDNAAHTTGIGVLTGAEYNSVGGTGTFNGASYTATSTLVKYTWNGDANLDGRVTFDDYVKIDTGFNTHLTGWLNGDFNYSGAVNFDDYVLIDIAFNQQNGTLGRAIDWISGDDRSTTGLDRAGVGEVIGHLDQFGSSYGAAFLAAVPEPASLAVLGVPALAGIVRRRRPDAR